MRIEQGTHQNDCVLDKENKKAIKMKRHQLRIEARYASKRSASINQLAPSQRLRERVDLVKKRQPTISLHKRQRGCMHGQTLTPITRRRREAFSAFFSGEATAVTQKKIQKTENRIWFDRSFQEEHEYHNYKS